jgi:hypothetical protein
MKSAQKMVKKHKGSLGEMLQLASAAPGMKGLKRQRKQSGVQAAPAKKENTSDQNMKRSGLPMEMDTASKLCSAEGYLEKDGYLQDEWLQEQKVQMLVWVNSLAKEIVQKRLNARKKIYEEQT